MGRYISEEVLLTSLGGKIRVTDDEDEDNKMPRKLLQLLIAQAEGQVETDLSPRYSAPFQGPNGESFSLQVVSSNAKQQIQTLCLLQGAVRVMETEFGANTVTDPGKFTDKLEARYTKIMDKLLERKPDSQRWKYPPLPGLQLNYMNQAGDTGFAGRVTMHHGHSEGGHPAGQINEPGRDFVNGHLGDED